MTSKWPKKGLFWSFLGLKCMFLRTSHGGPNDLRWKHVSLQVKYRNETPRRAQIDLFKCRPRTASEGPQGALSCGAFCFRVGPRGLPLLCEASFYLGRPKGSLYPAELVGLSASYCCAKAFILVLQSIIMPAAGLSFKCFCCSRPIFIKVTPRLGLGGHLGSYYFSNYPLISIDLG